MIAETYGGHIATIWPSVLLPHPGLTRPPAPAICLCPASPANSVHSRGWTGTGRQDVLPSRGGRLLWTWHKSRVCRLSTSRRGRSWGREEPGVEWHDVGRGGHGQGREQGRFISNAMLCASDKAPTLWRPHTRCSGLLWGYPPLSCPLTTIHVIQLCHPFHFSDFPSRGH